MEHKPNPDQPNSVEHVVAQNGNQVAMLQHLIESLKQEQFYSSTSILMVLECFVQLPVMAGRADVLIRGRAGSSFKNRIGGLIPSFTSL